MKNYTKITIFLLSLAVFLFFSCDITTDAPNLIKGRWGSMKDSSPEHELILNEDGTYTHTKANSDNTTDEYNGEWKFEYSSFEVTTCTGTLTLKGNTDGIDALKFEDVTYYFTFTATPERGPKSLELYPSIQGERLSLDYWGAAV